MYPTYIAENSISVGRERGEGLEGGWYKDIKVEGRDDEWTKKGLELLWRDQWGKTEGHDLKSNKYQEQA